MRPAGSLLHGAPPATWMPYPAAPNAAPGFWSAIGLPDGSQVNGTAEFTPVSANGLKMVLGVMPVLVEFTVPISSGLTLPVKSPASSSGEGSMVNVLVGTE